MAWLICGITFVGIFVFLLIGKAGFWLALPLLIIGLVLCTVGVLRLREDYEAPW